MENDDDHQQKQIEAATTDSGKEFANRIKAHHTKIRKLADQISSQNSDIEAWNAMKNDKAALKQYSSDMFHLATKFWRHGTTPSTSAKSELVVDDAPEQLKQNQKLQQQQEEEEEERNHSDRLFYILEAIEHYYFTHPVAQPTAATPATTQPQQNVTETSTSGDRRNRDDEKSEATTSASTANRPLEHQLLPALIAHPLKDFRRQCWQEKSRAATADECNDFISNFVKNVIMKEIFNNDEEKYNDKNSILCLKIVDIGSCYNPLRNVLIDLANKRIEGKEGHYLQECLIPNVAHTTTNNSNNATLFKLDPVSIGVDLCPHENSGVLQCDWFAAQGVEKKKSSETQDEENQKQVSSIITAGTLPQDFLQNKTEEEIAAMSRELQVAQRDLFPEILLDANDLSVSYHHFYKNSAHVVSFCLMLSYLPSATMRLKCCFNAFQFLKPHGLFVIVSTRTQNSRKSNWENQWISILEKIGFERFRKDIRQKIIGLCFKKRDAADFVGFETFEDIPENIRREGLPIRADDL